MYICNSDLSKNPFLAICVKPPGQTVGDKRDFVTAIVAHPHPNLRPALSILLFFVRFLLRIRHIPNIMGVEQRRVSAVYTEAGPSSSSSAKPINPGQSEFEVDNSSLDDDERLLVSRPSGNP